MSEPRLRPSPFALYDGSFRGAVLAGRAGPDRQVAAFHSNRSMTQATARNDAASGIQGVLLANRDRILRFLRLRGENRRASCRERVCQYVTIQGVSVSLQKKKIRKI